MTVAGAGQAGGAIPAEYTDAPYHLQFYVSALVGDRVSIVPGYGAGLAQQPYAIAMRL
jgi:hypothetical protein